LGKEEDIQPSY